MINFSLLKKGDKIRSLKTVFCARLEGEVCTVLETGNKTIRYKSPTQGDTSTQDYESWETLKPRRNLPEWF
jgi:hypothetical protein